MSGQLISLTLQEASRVCHVLWVIFKAHSRPPSLSIRSGFTRLLNFLFHYSTKQLYKEAPASPLRLCGIIHIQGLKRNNSMKEKQTKEWKQISNPNSPLSACPEKDFGVSSQSQGVFLSQRSRDTFSGLREQILCAMYSHPRQPGQLHTCRTVVP